MRNKVKSLGAEFRGSLFIRGLITCLIDDDETIYVIISFLASSFLLLGCYQINYEIGFFVLIGYCVVITLLDLLRTMLAYVGTKDISEIIVTSNELQSDYHLSVILKPINVYEDLARTKTITYMVFLTQCLLIGLVCFDLYDTPVTDCYDGTASNCPVVGTISSWSFYIIGAFMALVYKLGPKGKFGHSPQDPAYWLQLLLSAKNEASTYTWYEAVEHKTYNSNLSLWDVVPRFMCSTYINGMCFRFLVHSLPVQASNRSDFVSLVFASLFMLFIVDLDDTPGHPLKIVHPKEKLEGENEDVAKTVSLDKNASEVDEVAKEIERIINEARAKLDILTKQHNTLIPKHAHHNLGTGGLIVAGNPVEQATTFGNDDTSLTKEQIEKEDFERAHGAAAHNLKAGGLLVASGKVEKGNERVLSGSLSDSSIYNC
eukprot:CAMPEP_0178926356 /NCGR_PEP_ID=MMETSP0786-20121207/18484_1 /TAXON_ID=186022 /ORGANISM="Thalassionema frauenfeldii, Strain CCMP 1798" /LENGTH=429 /DNA_ID=CAMNT_0020601463 /DNA_START=267 /DNA_END=1559 /DNA_ORIENTATION=-